MVLHRALAFAAPVVTLGLQMQNSGHDADIPWEHVQNLIGSKTTMETTYVTGAGVVSTNDPEADLPSDRIKYHIRREGAQTLIGLPHDFQDYPDKSDQLRREDALFVATGDFEKIGPKSDDCDDHFLRSVEIQGQRLEKAVPYGIEPYGGTDTAPGDVVLKRLKFFVNDGEYAFDESVFNLTSSMGFEIETLNKTSGTRTVLTLKGSSLADLITMNTYVPFCNIHRPLGEIKLPTKKKFRHSSQYMKAICTLIDQETRDPMHEFGILFHTSWGGVVTPDGSSIYRKACVDGNCTETSLDLTAEYPMAEPSPAHPTIDWYTNNLWFYASNVSADPAGLLGPHGNDERAYATNEPPLGCYKPNVNGGKQYLGPFERRKGPKHPRHWK